MRKALMLAILAGVALVFTINAVSAYAYYNYDPYYDETRIYVGFTEPRYYGYGGYGGYYHNSPRYYGYDYDDDWYEDWRKYNAYMWLYDSYHARYDIASGRSSGDVYYNTYDPNVYPSTNWRYKEAYDYRDGGLHWSNDYYYKPVYDPELGYYNWRY